VQFIEYLIRGLASNRIVLGKIIYSGKHRIGDIGKPEPLKHAFKGYGSRRINDEHRIVYKVLDDAILLAQLRYHY